MSSANPQGLKWSKNIPTDFLKSLFKKIWLYYNIYIRNFKFFIKSSQFGEDKKIIKLFDKNKKGIYLDVGCFHPIRQNNTYLLNKLGWSGINIDLNPLAIELFNIARPNDVNICAAVSGKRGVKNLFFHHSLSTLNTLSKDQVTFLEKTLILKDLKKRKIKTTTLSYLLKKFKIRKIDFMNIDIEGSELEVLKTLNFKFFDIKVICIEIINYDFYSKKNKINNKKILNILKKNNYTLKFKTVLNFIFVKK